MKKLKMAKEKIKFPIWMKVLACAFFIFGFAYIIFGIIPSLQDNSKEEFYETKIIFDSSVNETEKICINNMINDIEPFLLERVRTIEFTHNESKFSIENVQGVNFEDNIIVLIPNFEFGLRSVICHEILHSWFEVDYLEEEKVISYINGRYVPCYPELFSSYIKEDCSLEVKNGN